MACPYFDPGERLPGLSGSLGDLYAGACCANPQNTCLPDEETVSRRCNLGYARGCCPHFPPDGAPDAIRFSVSSDDRSAIRILYAAERDHRPFASGMLDYSISAGGFAQPADASLARLASAYIRSYLRRTR